MREVVAVGRFLNKGNQKFAEFSRTKYFIDKTEILNVLLEKDADEKFICCSRPRRFGKSVTADMITAYFSRGADSRSLFEPLKCTKNELFLKSMNQYDTIFVDIQAQFVAAASVVMEPNRYIQKNIVKELQEKYSELISDDLPLMAALAIINNETGNQFVIIFDEWDYPIRERSMDNKERLDYIEFLRGLFKSSDAKNYIRLAYLTGILPMVRMKGQSAVNNFHEYTMIRPKDLGDFIGFTEEEVAWLCEKYHIDFQKMKEWYNGYNINGRAIYNPLSVVRAIAEDDFGQFWTETGTYEDIGELINRNFNGLREAVIEMLSGNRIHVNVAGCQNDMHTFVDKDQVITILIHLGYFAYDKSEQEAYVPNKEIQEVFYKYMENQSGDNLSKFMELSESIAEAVLTMDEDAAARLIQEVHNDFVSSIEYNDENSLSCTITVALLAFFQYYHKPVREFPCGKGFADIVYLPLAKHPNRPVVVVELKWNKDARTAIKQIKERAYPESLKDYSGEILLVGITYNKKTKEHQCMIENYQKEDNNSPSAQFFPQKKYAHRNIED
ncbi:MAG: ATP-binding protein [Lachnospiraceae bacterium]|nr:ATP-binding protein [Lachnospiraceae bacterium]